MKEDRKEMNWCDDDRGGMFDECDLYILFVCFYETSL